MKKHHRTTLQELFNVTDMVTIYYNELINSRIPNPSHKLDFWQLHYEIKGTKNIKINENTYTLKGGQMAFISPGASRQIQNFFGFNDSAICSFVCPSPAMNRFANRIIDLTDGEIDLFLKIIYLGSNVFKRVDTSSMYGLVPKENVSLGTLQALKLYLELFLILVYNRLTKEPQHIDLFNINLERSNENTVSNIKDYFAEHIREDMTIHKLSAHFNLSPTTLKTTFKKVTGETLMDYFVKLKIKEAKSLIRGGTMTLREISDLLSFSSPAYFSSAFKKHTGQTPSDFQKSQGLVGTRAHLRVIEAARG